MALPHAAWLLPMLLLTGPPPIIDDPAEEAEAEAPAPAELDADLPEGFPAPTAPDVIEVKAYPAYRSAVALGTGMTQRSGNLLFFRLFRHISEREVAMTAPVINTYLDPEMAVDPSVRGDLTMEFLYGTPDLGETGDGVGAVEVRDSPAMTVVALGVQGEMTPERMSEGVGRLRSWLVEHEGEWSESGPPRQLGYHGPMTPADRRLWEVQLPIAPADTLEHQSSTPNPR